MPIKVKSHTRAGHKVKAYTRGGGKSGPTRKKGPATKYKGASAASAGKTTKQYSHMANTYKKSAAFKAVVDGMVKSQGPGANRSQLEKLYKRSASFHDTVKKMVHSQYGDHSNSSGGTLRSQSSPFSR